MIFKKYNEKPNSGLNRLDRGAAGITGVWNFICHRHFNLTDSSVTGQFYIYCNWGRLRLKCDGTRTETRFRLSAKRTSPFKSAEASVQLTTGSRGVGISGGNAGYAMFRGSVKSTGYALHSPVFPSLPPVRHRVPSHFNWTLTTRTTRLSKAPFPQRHCC